VFLAVDGNLKDRSMRFDADFDRPGGRRSFAERK
jgi:hypothetical protein